MASDLSATLSVVIQAAQQNPLDLGSVSQALSKSYKLQTTNGVGAGQADKIFHDQRTLGPSATEDLDLAGVLLGAIDGTFTLARVKGLIVAAAPPPTQVNDVLVGGAAATVFSSWVGDPTDKVRVRPGGVVALIAGQLDATGYVTAAGATDFLRIGNGGAGTSVTYDIYLIGCSA